MAIQELTQPIINPIAAFDSTKEHEITFIVIGGAQVTGNRIVISDNQTGNVVYNNIVNTMKLAHTIPANTLSNGGYYNVVIYTIDNSANESAPSTPVPFYCYSQPTLTITNIPATETIGNGTYKFQGNYLQTENEQLNSYQFILYDSNKDILDRSDIIYYQSNNSLAYTFVGMDNDISYYVELKGQTVNSTEITSGLMYFTVRYTQPATFAIVDLINDCENGYIQISSNIVAIDGKSNPEPPIYIDDKEVDLRDKDSWVKWDKGFNINNDFTMRVWGRDFNDYEKIISLANKENTPDNPNKIEMKWMIADVLETLPSYTSVFGKNVAIKNGFKTDIKDLEVMGNSEQISKKPVDLGTGNYIKAETTRDMYLDIDVYGNQYQKQTIQNDNLLILEDTTITTNGITLTIKGGVITINGTSTASTNIDFKIKKKLKAGTYWHMVQRSGSAPSGNVSFLVMKSGGSIATINGNGGAAFTLNEDTEVFYRIWTNRNNTLSNVAYKCLISEGSDSKPWVQGIPDSPSVDYPSEIETVGSNVNHFNINGEITDSNASHSIDKNSIIVNAKYSYGYISQEISNLEANAPYILHFDGDNSPWIVIFSSDEQKIREIYSSNKISFNCPENGIIKIRIYATTSQTSAVKTFSNIKLEKGSVATPYSPYNQGSVEIDVVNKNLLNIANTEETTKGGITYSIKNGILKLNGTATASLDIQLSKNIKIKKGKYTHSSSYMQLGLYVSFDNLRYSMISAQVRKENNI